MKTTRERDKIAQKIVETIFNDLKDNTELEAKLFEDWDEDDIDDTKKRWLNIVKRNLVIESNQNQIGGK